MDSAHFLRLGFLLLALAVPRPNIAMAYDDPDEGTNISSYGKTIVAVYRCKDCDGSTCQAGPISFENFEKIAGTQTRIFSNEVIELVTGEKNITVCFKQGNPFLEGIFGIVWEKAGAAGHSCGIVNSGENGRGNISTEEKKICCETETDVWKHNPPLKCYTETSGPKPTPTPADIPGNPEPHKSQMTNTGILLTVAFLGVLTGMAIMYCYFWHRKGQAYRQDRQGPGGENLNHV